MILVGVGVGGAQVHVTHKQPHLPNVTNRRGQVPATKVEGWNNFQDRHLWTPHHLEADRDPLRFTHRAMDPHPTAPEGGITSGGAGGASSDYRSLVEKTPQPRHHQIQRPVCRDGCQRQRTVRRSILRWWDRVIRGPNWSILGNNVYLSVNMANLLIPIKYFDT